MQWRRRRLCRWAARRETAGPRTCSPNARCRRRPARKPASMARKLHVPVWRNRARQYRGRLSGRRRWRSVARLAGQSPRMVEFHNTILHPQLAKPRAATPRYAHFCSPIARLRSLCGACLPAPARPACVAYQHLSAKLWKIARYRLCCGLAAAILWPSGKRFRITQYSNRPPRVH